MILRQDKEIIMQIVKKYKIIIWDFDGTIVHLRIDWKSVKQEIISLLNGKGLQASISQPLNELFSLSKSIGIDSELLSIIKNHERKSEFVVDEEIVKIIRGINRAGLIQCILSDNFTDTIKLILAKIEILEVFDTILGIDITREFKPSPQGLQKLIENYKAEKDEVLYIGDSWKDKDIGSKEGIKFINIKELKVWE